MKNHFEKKHSQISNIVLVQNLSPTAIYSIKLDVVQEKCAILILAVSVVINVIGLFIEMYRQNERNSLSNDILRMVAT